MKPTILLRSGRYFDFTAPESNGFDIYDIAHALANLCRFTGHCREFYSVAQHSVMVSYAVPKHLALQGLMHDAAEAFVGDVASPLKRLLGEYSAIEARVEAAVFAHFGLPPKLDPEVKKADLVLLATEQRDLMNTKGEVWTNLKSVQPLTTHIYPVAPSLASSMFVRRYSELVCSDIARRLP